MTDFRSVVVVDPVSSSVHFGNAIQARGYRAVALISIKELSTGLRRLQNLGEFQHIIYAEDLESAVYMLARLNICAVIPGSDIGVILADQLSNYYGLVGNSIDTSLARVDKFCQKSTLISCGVPVAVGVQVGLDGIKKQDLKNLQYPVVVKPCRGTGSRNVKVCDSNDEVTASVFNILASCDVNGGAVCKALIEEYLSGKEYFMVTANFGAGEDKQLLCFSAYEKLLRQGSPSIYKNIRSLPLDDRRTATAFPYVKAVNNALDVAFGVNDVEFKIGQNGPLLIEQNGRMPGALVPGLIELCTGIDCYQLALDIYLGVRSSPVKPLEYKRHFCICCLISESAGRVKAIHGLDKVKSLKSFHGMNLYVSEGDYVEVTFDFLSAWGAVYLVHDSLEVLEAESELVHRSLLLQYKT